MRIRPVSGLCTVNDGGESSEFGLVSQSSPINHMRLCTAPTNGRESASGAEGDFAAEQKMHCIPTGIAWQICELRLSRGGALFVGIPEWLFHLRQTTDKGSKSIMNYGSFCSSTEVLLWHQIKVRCCWGFKKVWHFALLGVAVNVSHRTSHSTLWHFSTKQSELNIWRNIPNHCRIHFIFSNKGCLLSEQSLHKKN